ncbi:MAG TPA: nucleotide exchange factor GrpE [Catenuloplanes sp.]
MTDKPEPADAGDRVAPTAGGSASDEPTGEAAAERVVTHDNQKVDASGGSGAAGGAGGAADSRSGTADGGSGGGSGAAGNPAGKAGAHAAPDDDPDVVDPAAGDASGAGQPESAGSGAAAPLGAELQALRGELDERTRDLQRVTAEYANYRKRVDRDRGVAAEQTTGAVLTALLPVLDDLDRAREHGDLVGPFAAVAEQLGTALGKFGLTAFGEKGDAFDPTRHEAVAHLTSADVHEPTCVEVMRRGYLLGERMLRPALVAVADPE